MNRLERTGQLHRCMLRGRVFPLGSLRSRAVAQVFDWAAAPRYHGRVFTKSFCKAVVNTLHTEHGVTASEPMREALRLQRALHSAKRRARLAMSAVDNAETQAGPSNFDCTQSATMPKWPGDGGTAAWLRNIYIYMVPRT